MEHLLIFGQPQNQLNIKNMKKRKLFNIKIAIPIYNEERNIHNLLQSIKKQNNKYYILEKIIVVCDGCTDKSQDIVKKIAKNYPFISCKVYKQRKGKIERLNYLYKTIKSDLLITFDGDVVLGNRNVIDNMVLNFKDKKIMVVGANCLPIGNDNLFRKLMFKYEIIWYEVRKNLNGGNNIYNTKGAGVAFRTEFSRKIKLPKNNISETKYIYLKLKEEGLKYFFSKKAIVYFLPPNNLHDFLLQARRSEREREKLACIFGDWIYKQYNIPFKYKLRALIKMFVLDPLYTPVVILFIAFANKFPFREKTYVKIGVWTISKSTKIGINNINFDL